LGLGRRCECYCRILNHGGTENTEKSSKRTNDTDGREYLRPKESFLPLQGGGQEGDGGSRRVQWNPIPTLALPLKGREDVLR